MKNVAILGASGFVGQEIIKICLNHPHVKIVALSANKSAGETVQIHDSVGAQTPLKYKSYEDINLAALIMYLIACQMKIFTKEAIY